jgi:hypothetical protein
VNSPEARARVKDDQINTAQGRPGSSVRKMRDRDEGHCHYRSGGGRPRTGSVRVPGLWTSDERVSAAGAP